MNRPEARNALSGEMMAIMEAAWDRVNGDDSIRVVHPDRRRRLLLRRHGPQGRRPSARRRRASSPGFDPTVIKGLLKGFRLTKPLIAAVEGPAIAGGTEILQGTDIRIAGESARFGVSEARWSLYPMGGSAVRLPRQIPYTVAVDLLLTGRHIKAPEAKEIGLIGHVVPDGEALAKAHEIADLICANGPLAVQAILKTMRDSEGKHEDDCWAATPGRQGGLRLRGRQGGPAGLRREARAAVPGSLSVVSPARVSWRVRWKASPPSWSLNS